MLVCHIQALQNDLNMLETSCVSVTFRKYRKCILYNDSCVDYLITLSVGTYISYAALYVLQTCILIAACGFVFVLILIGVFTMLRNRYKAAVSVAVKVTIFLNGSSSCIATWVARDARALSLPS